MMHFSPPNRLLLKSPPNRLLLKLGSPTSRGLSAGSSDLGTERDPWIPRTSRGTSARTLGDNRLGRHFLRILVCVLLYLVNVTGFSNTLYPLDTPKQDAQFSHLLRDLRCLVCQNQDLADSNAGLAKDLRDEVYQLVKDQQSDDEIIHYMTARYGDFILFKPPVKTITALLWFGPLLFLIAGLVIFWRMCLRRVSV